MLDHQDRERPRQAPDQIDHPGGLGGRHARGWLVEQQELGFAGKRDTDLELTLFAIGKTARRPRTVTAEMHALHQFLGALDQGTEALDRREEIQRMTAPRFDCKP